MTAGEGVIVPGIGMVDGGLVIASIHNSMVPIIIIQLFLQKMALFGPLGKVLNILSSSQR